MSCFLKGRKGFGLISAQSVLLAMVSGLLLAGVASADDDSAVEKQPGSKRAPYAYSMEDISWPHFPKASKDAPNIVLIMLDDVGFSASSTFGGLISTPVLDELAADGIRYNRFHTAGVCSPTRAALLTGRNPHQVGIGGVPQLAAGYPGYDAAIDKDTASVARLLKDGGYNTAAFGKWHLEPPWEAGRAGPFDHWPTGLGFEHYYGCLSCLTEWEPNLYQGTDPISKPDDENYILTKDLVNHSIKWMANQKAIAPSKPFFIYLAPTATHAPVHAPKEYIDRYKGKFDKGWDAMREEVFSQQKSAGIIPADAQLSPRPDRIAAWDSLSANEQKLFARQMEAYAGYLAYTDHEVGRLFEAIERAGQSENTLVIYIVGDNGASAEGGLQGSITNMAMLQGGGQESVEQQLAQADKFGSREFDLHFAAGWTSALDVPFPWMKQVASHLGGTRNGMIVSWPGKTNKSEKIRSQFSYVTDVTATILEAAGIDFPESVDGVKQVPLEGKSLIPTFTNPDAPEVRDTQYFAVNDNVSVYHKGWMLSSVNTLPWDFFSGVDGRNKSGLQWELYNLEADFSQTQNLADSHPKKLKEMIDIFYQEAQRNDVLPLKPPFLVGAPRLEVPGKTEMLYLGEVENLPLQAIPLIDGKSHVITAKLTAPNKAEGVIVAAGGRYGGFALYVKDGRLVYVSNSLNQYRDTVTSSKRLPSGDLEIAVRVESKQKIASASANAIAAGGGFTRGSVTLYVNGDKFAEGDLRRFGGMMLSETFDIGKDNNSPVTDDYQGVYPFSGEIRTVKVEVSK